MLLATSFAEEDGLDRFEEDSKFEEEGHVLDIKGVVLKLLDGIFPQMIGKVLYA
jgi:hypothetical protein